MGAHVVGPAIAQVVNQLFPGGNAGPGALPGSALAPASIPGITPPVPHTTIFDDINQFFVNWGQTLMILLFAVLLLLFWKALRTMPRTRPQQIRPDDSPQIVWGEIAGADEAKEELREVVEFLQDPGRFRKLGAQVPKGILLHGPPGTGKTLLAKAAAHESGAQFFAQSASAFVEMFAGLGASRIRRLFKEARKHSPAIIFIDELDAVGGHRGADISGEKDQTLNQLLVEMDGFSGRGDVVVVAASNLLEKLDTALLRPGRFDRQIFVSPPDVRGRQRILEVHTRQKPLVGVDLEIIARQTSGLTGADLANICNEAAIFAARREAAGISQLDFDHALERIVAGVRSRRALNDHEKQVVACHEAGHALCAELLSSVDRVHKISIVPRGKALGYTLNLPEEDRYLKTRDELVEYMTMLLGGRVAEQIVFGSVTTGASDDLRRVGEITRSMIGEYAMGTGFTSQRVLGEDNDSSERTRRLRDEEQQDLADEARRKAMALLMSHREQLDALAMSLLRNEVLERDEIDRIMQGVRPVGRPAPVHGLEVAAAVGEQTPGIAGRASATGGAEPGADGAH